MGTRRTIAFLLACLLGAATGSAQHQTQDGRLLDANPSTAGRFNQPGPPVGQPQGNALAPGSYSNAIVMGQAGMGRSFQGSIPYKPFDQFQGNLPSTTLYNFNRDSVNLYQVMQSPMPPSALAPIYQANLRSVVGGWNLPSPGQTFGGAVLPQPINPYSMPSYVLTSPRTGQPSMVTRPIATPLSSPLAPGTPDLLNLRNEALLEQQAPEPREYAPLLPSVNLPDRLKPVEVVPAPAATPLGDQLRFKPIQGRVGEEPAAERKESPWLVTAPLGAREAGITEQRITTRLAPGEDLYYDLLLRERAIRRRSAQADKPQDKGQPAKERPDATWLSKSGLPGALRMPETPIGPGTLDRAAAPPAPALPAVLPDPMLPLERPRPPKDDPLAGLPGVRPYPLIGRPDEAADSGLALVAAPLTNLAFRADSFVSSLPGLANVAMRQAESEARQGRYYQALDALVRARRYDPANPLVWLRTAHVYVGTGEFYSAALNLRRAMRLFPSVVTVRTDLENLFPKGVLDDRLAELQRNAQRFEEPDLWTLLCYLQYANGRFDEARQTAIKRLARFAASQPADASASPSSGGTWAGQSEAAELKEFVLRQNP